MRYEATIDGEVAPIGTDPVDPLTCPAPVWNGGFAEYAVAPLKAVAPTPAALTQEQAAAVGVNYATALFALQIGFAAGDIPTIRVNRLLLRNVSVVGVAFGAFLDVDPALLPRLAVTLDRLAEEGWLRPHIRQTFAFDEIPRALDLLGEARIQGKAVAVL